MRVLWLCSFAPGSICEALGIEKNRFGGWIDSALKKLVRLPEISLGVCYPQTGSTETIRGETALGEYYGIYLKEDVDVYDRAMIQSFRQVFQRFRPDVIHIWGAEFPFFYAAVIAAEHQIPVVCSIQGLCGVCAVHYYGYLPDKVVRSWTLRDFLRRDNLPRQRQKFVERGQYEKKILSEADYILGRTNWDKTCASLIAPNTEYLRCNETLRDSFYQKADQWDYHSCEKHSIFISQASYPLKGFHLALEAMTLLLEKYPDLAIYTTGQSPFDVPWYRIGSYQRYLKEYIKEHGLRDQVRFLGSLDETQMCAQYLRSHVFVSASSIENSSNSVGEAMLLGMPVVASYAGGTMDLLSEPTEGYLYQADAPYMLASCIDAVFAAGESAKEMGRAASLHAMKTHDPEKNAGDLWEIYRYAVKENDRE